MFAVGVVIFYFRSLEILKLEGVRMRIRPLNPLVLTQTNK